MALKGNLKDFHVTQLFNLVNLARKTGALTIEGRDKRAEVCFKEGRLVYASLNGQERGLIGMLEKAGKSSSEQSRVIRARSRSNADKELGLLLINAGYVTQEDIVRSVRAHTLDVVYVLFTWTDGSFVFEPNKLPAEGAITVPIKLENIIREGSRRVKEYEMLQNELPDLDLALKFTERPDSRLRDINLTVEEWRVISFINPRNTIRQSEEDVDPLLLPPGVSHRWCHSRYPDANSQDSGHWTFQCWKDRVHQQRQRDRGRLHRTEDHRRRTSSQGSDHSGYGLW